MYDDLLSQTAEYPTALYKWKEKCQIVDTEWENKCSMIYKATNSTKLQEFQYKVVNRYSSNKRQLFLMKLKENEVCPFCPRVEDMDHMLFSCGKTFEFWKKCKYWWAEQKIPDVIVNYKNILFGTEKSCTNLLIILGKYIIYRNRLRNETPNFQEYKNYALEKIREEKFICMN